MKATLRGPEHMPRGRALFLLALLLSLGPALPTVRAEEGRARTRPDQVLVLYNQDWIQDLDGSDPGQDSEEIARYYVERRTDARTGRHPWLLGLSAGGGADSPLNRPVLEEPSRDNELGLVWTSGGGGDEKRVPLSSASGDASVPPGQLRAGLAPARFAALLVRSADLGAGVARVEVTATQGEEPPTSLAVVRPGERRLHPACSILPAPTGALFVVDLGRLGEGTFRIAVEVDDQASGEVRVEGEFALPEETRVPGKPTAVEEARRRVLSGRESSGPLPGLLTTVDLVAALSKAPTTGFLLPAGDFAKLEPGSLVLTAEARGKPAEKVVLYDAASEAMDLAGTLWSLSDGSLLFASNLASRLPGSVVVKWKGRQKGGRPFERSLNFDDPATLRLSATGADGIRDDAQYVELVEEPVRRFLETHRTDDGIPLIDHILYVVIVRGLPIRVRCLYGIERGVMNADRDDVGTGSSLCERLMLLRYEGLDFKGAPTLVQVPTGRAHADKLLLAHPLRAGLAGPSANPLLHPLAHRRALREAAFREEGPAAVGTRAPAPLSSELLNRTAAGKRILGVTRVDGFSVEEAKARVDGAIYAERYLTPKLGPAFCGKTHEAKLTARALKARGFDVRAPGEPAERALYWFGVFSGGSYFAEDLEPGDEENPVWTRGFLPGSVGYAMRSFLRWSLDEPPRQIAKLFEQSLRAGVTVGAGSAGGAHETTATWPDSFVLTQMLLDGYDLGDALLRSTFYVDWTMSFVGDPLYRSPLRETVPDETAPVVASPADVSTKLVPVGPDAFALRVEVALSNRDPEMAEIRVVCRPSEGKGNSVVGENSLFSLRPAAWTWPLRPGTDYEVEIILTDAYGNRTSTTSAFGKPLNIRTATAPGSEILKETRLRDWLGKDVLRFDAGALDDAGEIEIRFTAAKGRKGVELPRIRSLGGHELLSWRGDLSVGGAEVYAGGHGGLIQPGSRYHLVLRWRREPVTREVYLVAGDGTEHLVASADRLPWDPAFSLSNGLVVESDQRVEAVTIRTQPPVPPRKPGIALPRKLDARAFREHDSGDK